MGAAIAATRGNEAENSMRMAKHNGWRAAFTLIELLLAIGIFSMVLIAIYSSWSAILQGSRRGLTAAAEVQRTRVAVRALEEALGSAVLYADNAKYYAFFADTSGDFTYLSFVARLSDSFPGSGLFHGQPVRRVTFMVDSEKNLKLTQMPILEACDQLEKPYTITLTPKVSTFAVEFFETRKREWIPEWTMTNQLPRMVRLAVDFGQVAQGQDRSAHLTLRTIPLSAVAITRGAGVAPPMTGRRSGGFSRLGQEQGWSPCLPDTFGANSGNITRNPIFPQ